MSSSSVTFRLTQVDLGPVNDNNPEDVGTQGPPVPAQPPSTGRSAVDHPISTDRAGR